MYIIYNYIYISIHMEWWTPCDEDLSKGISWAELREVLRLRGSRSLSTESTNPCAARCWWPWGISAPSRPMLRPSSFREQNVKQNGNFCGVPLGHTHLIDGFIMFHIFFQCYILELEWMMIPTDFHDLSRTFEMGGWTPVSSYPGIWGRVS